LVGRDLLRKPKGPDAAEAGVTHVVVGIAAQARYVKQLPGGTWFGMARGPARFGRRTRNWGKWLRVRREPTGGVC